jgi:hypothetical protein
MGVIGHLVARDPVPREEGTAGPAGDAAAIDNAMVYSGFRGFRAVGSRPQRAGITGAVT